MRQISEAMPTTTRKTMKMFLSKLPRKGGPGRQPKLDSKQASLACDQIAVFISQKHPVKEASVNRPDTAGQQKGGPP
jgi:hypothetical protein